MRRSEVSAIPRWGEGNPSPRPRRDTMSAAPAIVITGCFVENPC
jgi:hypothetical protein